MAIAGVAQADGMLRVPGPDGVIHACYSTDNGKLRLVDPQQEECRREEAPLQWNQTGPQGPKGDPGAPGAAGANGAPGVSGYQQVVESNNNFTLAPGTESVHVVSCPAGKKVLSGGFVSFNANGFLSNNTNGPNGDGQWAVSVYNPGPNAVTIGTENFYALCANVN
jgi:hypothetical protein